MKSPRYRAILKANGVKIKRISNQEFNIQAGAINLDLLAGGRRAEMNTLFAPKGRFPVKLSSITEESLTPLFIYK